MSASGFDYVPLFLLRRVVVGLLAAVGRHEGAVGGDGGERLDDHCLLRVYLWLRLHANLRHAAFRAAEPDGGFREEMLGEGTEYFGIHGAELEVGGTVEPHSPVLRLALTEQAGEGEELETALPVGVTLLVQPLRERAVEVGVNQPLQQVIVLDRNL
jgi:hypothetical protein